MHVATTRAAIIMSPRLVLLLWSEGHEVRGTIIHVRNRRLNGASDHTIWRAAIDEDRTVCTINGKDFKKLAAATGLHPGVIDIPRGDTILNSLGSIRPACRACDSIAVTPSQVNLRAPHYFLDTAWSA